MPYISDFTGEYVGTRVTEDMEPSFSPQMMMLRSSSFWQTKIRRGNKMYFPSKVEPDRPEPLNLAIEGARGQRGPKGDPGNCACVAN
jgi:hypothetical protein